MHNANYTKEMNSNEEIFQLEIKKIMIILKIMLNINHNHNLMSL
jgi:hypothetical protein